MKKKLLDYFKSEKLMAVATYGENPWMCWVYYVVDDDFNLYFISDADSQHGQDIENNNQVAVGIADSHQEVGDEKKGVQLWGEVSVVKGVEKLKWFFQMWARINPDNKDKINYKNYAGKILGSNIYKISPKKIKWFNDGLADKEFVLV